MAGLGLGGGHMGMPNLGSTAAHLGMPHAVSPSHMMPRPMAGGLGSMVPHMAAGGPMTPMQSTPWFDRRDASSIGGDTYHPGGLINSSVPGRTDRIPLAVAADSHVIPADVVAGLGQGNTMAGSLLLDQMMSSGPYGIPLPRGGHGAGPPRPPRAEPTQGGFAGGGAASAHTPILAAGGEYIVKPEAVLRLGGGNMKKGHDILDQFIHRMRAHNIEFAKNAPKPKK